MTRLRAAALPPPSGRRYAVALVVALALGAGRTELLALPGIVP